MKIAGSDFLVLLIIASMVLWTLIILYAVIEDDHWTYGYPSAHRRFGEIIEISGCSEKEKTYEDTGIPCVGTK